MKTLKVNIETDWNGAAEVIDVEINDDATQQEIEEAAREAFFECCNYSFWVEGDD